MIVKAVLCFDRKGLTESEYRELVLHFRKHLLETFGDRCWDIDIQHDGEIFTDTTDHYV